MLDNQKSLTRWVIWASNLTERIRKGPLGLLVSRNVNSSPAANALFAEKVAPGKEWDHKKSLELLLPVDLSNEGDRMLAICDLGQSVNYDYFSNMHYGYLGTRAGFAESHLVFASHFFGSGVSDAADDIPIRAGVKLAKMTDHPSVDVVDSAIRESLKEALALGYTGLTRPL